MPNWCNNSLKVSGKDDAVAKFMAEVQRDETYSDGKKGHLPFSFEKILPTPEALNNEEWQRSETVAEENKKKYGYKGWYDFHIAKWGTKWELSCETEVEVGKGKVTYTFQTAWAPPTRIIAEAAKLYPDLKFEMKFCEQGMEYAGVFTAKGDEAKEETYGRNDARYKKMNRVMGAGSG
jgi:hypothetical protein